MEQNNIYQLVFKVTHAGGSGSCFYLKDYDLFVTNYHVVKGFHAVAVHDNDRNPYLAKVVLVNPSLDIALLFVDGDFSALPSLNLAEDTAVFLGVSVKDVHERTVKVVILVRRFEKLCAVRSIEYIVNACHSLVSLLLGGKT